MPITQDRMLRLLQASSNAISRADFAKGIILSMRDSIRLPGGPIAKIRAELAKLDAETLHNPALVEAINTYERTIEQIFAVAEEQLQTPIDSMRVLIEEEAHFKYRRKANESNRVASQRYRQRKWAEEHPNENQRLPGRPPSAEPPPTDVTQYLTPRSERVPGVSDAWYEAKAAEDAKKAIQLARLEAHNVWANESTEDAEARLQKEKDERLHNEAIEFSGSDVPYGFVPTVSPYKDPERYDYELKRAKRRAEEERQNEKPRTGIV